MRIRRSASAAIAAACLLVSSSALADEFSRTGYYANAMAVYGFQFMNVENFSKRVTLTPFPVSANDSYGFNIRVGERLKSWLAIEVEYEYMNGFAIFYPGGQLGNYNPDVLTLNGRFYWPFWRTQPYLVVGGGFVSYDFPLQGPYSSWSASETAFAFRGGGGIDIYLTKNIVLNIEATMVLNTDTIDVLGYPAIEDLYYLGAGGGLSYRF